jgi:hypothetical protein
MEEYTEEIAEEAAQEIQQDVLEENKEDQQFFGDSPIGQADLTGYSEPKPVGGLYALFQDILDKKDSTKVSNIDPKTELGDLGISIRDCKRVALIGNTFHHPKFAAFFNNQALIVSDTAMSKKGWFQELFISSKKFAEKSSSQNLNLPQPQQTKKKFSIFGS